MLTIRNAQMAAFAESLRNQFERRMETHLRSRFPERAAAYSSANLTGLVRGGIKQAAHYGIELEPDIRRYLELSLEYGPEFDRDPKLPWAAEILNQDLDGTEKLQQLDEYELFLPRKGSA